MEKMQNMSLESRIKEEIKTWIAFSVLISVLPFFAVSYLVVTFSKHYWLKLVSKRYSHLEFIKKDTIRTLLDTHRNQGVVNVILCVDGKPNTSDLKQLLIDRVIERRDQYGNLQFPRMRTALVSCWGSYAWDPHIPFQIENHFILAPEVYRGRPVGDLTIQNFVSDLVSKYFPADQPPWQYIVIPSSITDKHYILIRIHHLLMSCEKPIAIGDMVFTQQPGENSGGSSGDFYCDEMEYKLTALPKFYEKLGEMCSNSWNEFIAEYDPLESSNAFKTQPGIFHCMGLAVIVLVNAFKDVRKGSRSENSTTVSLFISALRQECHRRNITLAKIILSPFVTFDPRKFPKYTFSLTLNYVKFSIMWPIVLYDEVASVKAFLVNGRPKYPNTIAYKWAEIVTLGGHAFAELWKLLLTLHKTPRVLYEDIFKEKEGSHHDLQKVSLGGRKVCAWSRPIHRATIARICKSINVTPSDIYFYAATEAIAKYLSENKHDNPDYLHIITKDVGTDLLKSRTEPDGYMRRGDREGTVYLTVPVHSNPSAMRKCLQRTIKRQRILSLARPSELSHALPSACARITINLLSRKFTLMFSHLRQYGGNFENICGKKMHYIVCWTPPQANASMSLTVVEYADSVRVGVMCDARLSPDQTIPAEFWPEFIEAMSPGRSESKRAISEKRTSSTKSGKSRRYSESVQTLTAKKGSFLKNVLQPEQGSSKES